MLMLMLILLMLIVLMLIKLTLVLLVLMLTFDSADAVIAGAYSASSSRADAGDIANKHKC